VSVDELLMDKTVSYIFHLQMKKFNIMLRVMHDGETELIKKKQEIE
jgi:hypothetical protein